MYSGNLTTVMFSFTEFCETELFSLRGLPPRYTYSYIAAASQLASYSYAKFLYACAAGKVTRSVPNHLVFRLCGFIFRLPQLPLLQSAIKCFFSALQCFR